MLFSVHSSYEFCPPAQFRKPPETSHLETTVAREFRVAARFATRILKTRATKPGTLFAYRFNANGPGASYTPQIILAKRSPPRQ